MVMNLKLRLEKLCDQRSWVRIYFIDNSAITGRILRIGHDYLEIESYGNEDSPKFRDCEKHLISLSVIKLITIESSQFSDEERKRLNYLAKLDSESNEA